MSVQQTKNDDLTMQVGSDEIVIRRRYETLSITNDVLTALWFVVGSVLLFWKATSTAANWMFLVGSIEFLARPAIRLARRLHLQRVRGDGHGTESAYDF